MSDPLVSVLLPVYNAEPYLPAALASIMRQDYRHIEIIAIDDGSTDRSLDILRQYQQVDGRITIISRPNRGLITSLNEGLHVATGALVARMDADDIAYPWRLSRQVAAFREQPELAICGAGVDTLLGDRILRGRTNPIYRAYSLRVLSMFFTIFIHSTVVYNRRVIPDDMLRYDPRYLHAEDFDLFSRIIDRFPAAMIDESLIAYRIHSESVTNKHKRRMRQTHLEIVADNLQREGLIVNPAPLRDIGDTMTFDTVARAADSFLVIEDEVALRPMRTKASLEQGVLELFYFLYQLIVDEGRPELTHQFLTRTRKWHLIRRRERYGLFFGAHAPWLSRVAIATTKRADALARHMKTVPAANLLLHYAADEA